MQLIFSFLMWMLLGAQGRIFEDAVNDQQFQLLTKQEVDENVQQADTPAVEPDIVDTGFGGK